MIAQQTSVDASMFESLGSVYSLADNDNLTYLKIDYIPTGLPTALNSVTSASFTDTRPANFSALNLGYIASGTSARETAYLLYNGTTDTLIFARNSRISYVTRDLARLGLGTPLERERAFQVVKDRSRVVPVDVFFNRLVEEDSLQYGALSKLVFIVALCLGAGLSLYIGYKLMVRFFR